jgi:hypothetical protein
LEEMIMSFDSYIVGAKRSEELDAKRDMAERV